MTGFRTSALVLALVMSPAMASAQELGEVADVNKWEIELTFNLGQEFARGSTPSDLPVPDYFTMGETLRVSRRFWVGDPRLGIETGASLRFPNLDLPTDVLQFLGHLGVVVAMSTSVDLSIDGLVGAGLQFFDSEFGTGTHPTLDVGGRLDLRYYVSDRDADPRVFIGFVLQGTGSALGPDLWMWSGGIAMGLVTGKRSEESF